MVLWSLKGALGSIFSRPRIDVSIWEDLEDTLILADFGPEITQDILGFLKNNVEKYRIVDPKDLTRILREHIEERLSRFDGTLDLSRQPAVVLIVGVNGVGKTTTIGKLARLLTRRGKKVILGAGDTFRAGAVEQLATWGAKAGAEVIAPHKRHQDPAAVAHNTVAKAIGEGYDVAIVDTAGRLQTKSSLMDELAKIHRVISKLVAVAEVLLVLDASTGQNGLIQVSSFVKHANITGLVLTKMDGSAKGGFLLRVQESSSLPVKLVGVGEGLNDLLGFSPQAFTNKLLG